MAPTKGLGLGLTRPSGYTAPMAPRARIADLPNLGPKSAALLAAAGIREPAALAELGAVRAYLRVRRSGREPGLDLLYALHGALTGRRRHRIPRDEKLDLVRELEFAGDLLGAPDTPAPERRHPDYERIYAVVKRIPAGRVATYGQVAQLAGLPGRARQVGYALHKQPGGRDIPWHRVLNAQGRLSLAGRVGREQRRRLEDEGVEFSAEDRLALARYQWRPREGRTAAGR